MRRGQRRDNSGDAVARANRRHARDDENKNRGQTRLIKELQKHNFQLNPWTWPALILINATGAIRSVHKTFTATNNQRSI